MVAMKKKTMGRAIFRAIRRGGVRHRACHLHVTLRNPKRAADDEIVVLAQDVAIGDEDFRPTAR
jgi:hypothetical protein